MYQKVAGVSKSRTSLNFSFTRNLSHFTSILFTLVKFTQQRKSTFRISQETLLLVFDVWLLGVWISDKTLLLVFDILLLGVWISDGTLLIVFDILLLVVWISDKTLLVFEVLRDIKTNLFLLLHLHCFASDDFY